MDKLTAVLFFLFAGLTVPGVSQQVVKRIPFRTVPDGVIGFLEFRPADYDSALHPLIIFLHGTMERGNGRSEIQAVAAQGIPRDCAAGASMSVKYKGKTVSFIVLSPQLSRQYGAWPSLYVRAMINYAKENLRVDTNRIYVTGLSLGGGGVWRAISEYSGLNAMIAAAAPICGTQDMVDSNFCTVLKSSRLPVWAFHSLDDKSVPVQCTQHAEVLGNICKLSPAIKISYFPSGGHEGAWLHAYDTTHAAVKMKKGAPARPVPTLYEWFLDHSLLDKSRQSGIVHKAAG